MANRVNSPGLSGDFELGNDVTTTSDTVPIALALTLDGTRAGGGDWFYTTEAENPGSTGDMDLDAGLVYQGPAGTTGYFVVQVSNADVEWGDEGTADPDNEDTVSVDVYVNGTKVISSDEGQSAMANEGAEVEFNVTSETVALTEGDVLRFALTPVAANESSITWDVEEGCEWSVS